MSKKIEQIIPNPEKILPIRFLLVDVDGVMTDGGITYSSDGSEIKTFNVKDGSGLMWWRRAGHAAGIVTGRSSPMVLRRAKELEIEFVEMDAKHKLPAFERILAAAGVSSEEVAVIGDDLPDLPLVKRAGLGIAVADAVDELKDAAAMITSKNGGKGAVREVIELILKTQGRWDVIMNRYLI
jgi:3-deoxy-D-manno-octulosonate 8-phosphate phosphatase (KDO 8-P phosphatase)